MQFVAGICKRCRIDHLEALRMKQSAEDLRTEQYEPPDQVQSNVLLSFSVHAPDPFLSPAPLMADDVESSLEVCHCIVALSIIFESGIFRFF